MAYDRKMAEREGLKQGFVTRLFVASYEISEFLVEA